MSPRWKGAYHRRRMWFDLYCEDHIAGEDIDGVVSKLEKLKQSSGIEIKTEETLTFLDLNKDLHPEGSLAFLNLHFQLLADLDLSNLVYDTEKWQIDEPSHRNGWDYYHWKSNGFDYIRNEKTGEFMNRFHVKWEKDKHNTFTCFSNLPTELRLMVWKQAFPGPRVVQLAVFQDKRLPDRDESGFLSEVYVCFLSLGNDKAPLDIYQEWREVFLQHYTQL